MGDSDIYFTLRTMGTQKSRFGDSRPRAIRIQTPLYEGPAAS